MKSLGTQVRALGALTITLLVSLVAVFSTVGTASAAPTAEFTFSPPAPAVRQPVTFTFQGTCDVPPCTIEWRWFQTGGSSLGTSMGRGEVISYAFPRAGIYTVRAKITNASSTHGSAFASHSLQVNGTFEDNDRRVEYAGWSGANLERASGGGFRSATVPGTAASLVFTGPEVAYVARTGPFKGIARVSVDGAQTLVDLYSPTPGSTSFPVTGLIDGRHRIRVAPTGTRNAASNGTAVTLDEFVVGTTHVDDTSSTVGYGTWAGAADAGASGGTLRTSSRAGATTEFVFWGPSVTWVTTTGPGEGIATVTIDGAEVATVDGYSPTQVWRVERSFAALGEGRHVIRVTVAGAHNPSSTGDRVGSDAFIVR